MIHTFWHKYVMSDRSETIAFARIQMFIGAVWTVLAVADVSPILSGKYLTLWLIFSGALTEYLRRRGTEVRDGVIRSIDTIDKAAIPVEVLAQIDRPVV